MKIDKNEIELTRTEILVVTFVLFLLFVGSLIVSIKLTF